MHPDTFDVLKTHRMANKDNFAWAIAELLEQHDVQSLPEVEDHAKIVDEIREGLLGDSYPDYVVDELNDMVGEMTRPRGLVYELLNDNLSLCTAPVRRKTFTAEGVSVVVRKTARFVSSDADIVMQFRLDAAVQRLERTMERVALTIGDDLVRIPALATKTPAIIARANRVMAAQLPAPSNGGNTP